MKDEFFLDDAVKRLDTSIVITVPFVAHACFHVIFTQHRLIVMRSIFVILDQSDESTQVAASAFELLSNACITNWQFIFVH
jgi:hypothetical protein